MPTSEPPAVRGVGRRRVLLGLALSVLSAVILYVILDGHGSLWPLVVVAFVPMYVAQYRLLPRKWSGLAVGIAFFGYWLSLLMYAMTLADDLGSVLGPVVIVVASLVFAALMFVVGIFERPFAERTNYRWFLVQLPLTWVGLEVLFASNPLFASNFWIAYRVAAVPALDQPVSILSTPALSFLLMVINAAIALVVLRLIDRRWPRLATAFVPKRAVRWSSIIVACATVAWVGSSLLINWQVDSNLGPKVRVAAVQTGLANTTHAHGVNAGDLVPGSASENARNARLQAQLERLTRTAASEGAQLVVWPELILRYDAATPEGAWVGRLASETRTTIVAGYMPIPDAPSFDAPNMAGVWLPSGEMAQPPYYKIHAVPLMLEGFDTPKRYPTYEVPFGQMGIMICFDHDFPNDSARQETLGGADILAVSAGDPASVAEPRWQSLAFRAMENRVPLIKSNLSAGSTIAQANGVVEDRAAAGDDDGEALIVADVNLGPRGAPFTWLTGYPFAAVVLIACLARYASQIRSAWRSRRS